MRLHKALLFCLFCTTAGMVFGQTQTVVTFDIPFVFQLRNEVFPAGLYEVSNLPGLRGALVIRQLNRGNGTIQAPAASAVTLTTSVNQGKISDVGKLVFHRYDEDNCFLSTYWKPYSRTGQKLAMSEAEKALVLSYSSPPRQISLLALPARVQKSK